MKFDPAIIWQREPEWRLLLIIANNCCRVGIITFFIMKELLLGVWTDNGNLLGGVSCILPWLGRCTENVWTEVSMLSVCVFTALRVCVC